MTNNYTSPIAAKVLAQQKQEKNITAYKIFYKTHLKTITDHSTILPQLYNLCVRFQKTELKTMLLSDPHRRKLEVEAETIIKKYFLSDILKLFKKESRLMNRKGKFQIQKIIFGLLYLRDFHKLLKLRMSNTKESGYIKPTF